MIGIDIVSIERIENALKKYDKKFLERFLQDEEISLIKKSQTAAGFWAAKEAIAKALGCGIGKELNFHDITIKKRDNGSPYFILNENIKREFKITSTALSISHDGGFAIAVAVIM
ncbi:MAG TPA: holo-ACP synthase [Sulfurimonas autotrophica]|nr:holo-ACP synthase [Sulfurimonas autotrophica]